MHNQSFIRFVFWILIVTIMAQGVFAGGADRFTEKKDTPLQRLQFSSAQTDSVFYGLPGQSIRYHCSLLYSGPVHLSDKTHACGNSHIDRLYLHEYTKTPFRAAKDPTLFALNCMLTV